MDWQAIGTIIAVVIALVASIWQYFVVITSLKKDVTDLATNLRVEAVASNKTVMDLLTDQGNRLTRMETKMELFWNAVGTSMSKLIKQPTHFRKDELMDRLVAENRSHLPESTIDELVELKLILKNELVELQEAKDPKSLAYSLAIAYIDQILYDKGLFKGECR
jgi:hypothetical protein